MLISILIEDLTGKFADLDSAQRENIISGLLFGILGLNRFYKVIFLEKQLVIDFCTDPSTAIKLGRRNRKECSGNYLKSFCCKSVWFFWIFSSKFQLLGFKLKRIRKISGQFEPFLRID